MTFTKRANISYNTEESFEETTPVVTTKLKFAPTDQQVDCHKLIMANDLVKIGAIAGSGKTSLLQYTSENNRVPSLYLAYNRKMADEAKEKFMGHVDCMTIHSLAYRRVGKTLQHKLKRPTGRYRNVAGTGSEIAIFFKIPDLPVDEETYVSKNYIGLMIRDTVNKFEYSADDELSDKNIPTHHLKDVKKRFPDVPMRKLKRLITRYAQDLWEERTDTFSEVLCTHDTYLKLFQLKKLKLTDYSVIYLDESQDANDCTLDIFLNQKDHAKLVLCGDPRQQIYAYRGSVNAMDKVSAAEGVLTRSFRYGDQTAKVASMILENKVEIEGDPTKNTTVGDSIDYDKPYTILFRTNIELIFNAIDLLGKGEEVDVNLDIQDFTKMLTSAKALHTDQIKKVKHEDILPFTKWEDFVEESKYRAEFSRIVTFIENGDEDRILETLHSYKAKGSEKITLVTAHRSKGLEWNQVVLADDFPSVYDNKGNYRGLSESEQNLLYVAVTRGIEALQVNSTVKDIMEYNSRTTEDDTLFDLVNEDMTVRKVRDCHHTATLDDPFNLPKGDGASDALNRGLDEYMHLKDSAGMTQYELNGMPWTASDMRKEINSLMKDL